MDILDIKDITRSIGLTVSSVGPLGDLILISSIPENVYKTHGIKLIDIRNLWIFDNNPYVLRGIIPDDIITLDKSIGEIGIKKCRHFFLKQDFSYSSILCKILNANLFLRHPRLYKFEDILPNPNFIAIHTTPGGSGPTKGIMPQYIIDYIFQTYQNYTFFQVGAASDTKILHSSIIDKTGLDFWGSAEVISKCGTFIGLDSGPTHMANCYPRTRKKVLLFQNKYLDTLIPQDYTSYGNYIDFNCEYYNTSPIDIGISMSYLKI